MANGNVSQSRIELPRTIQEAVRQGYECDSGCETGAPETGKVRGTLTYTKELGDGHVSSIKFPYRASFQFGRRVR